MKQSTFQYLRMFADSDPDQLVKEYSMKLTKGKIKIRDLVDSLNSLLDELPPVKQCKSMDFHQVDDPTKPTYFYVTDDHGVQVEPYRIGGWKELIEDSKECIEKVRDDLSENYNYTNQSVKDESKPDLSDYISQAEVLAKFNTSTTTLWRMRKKGELTHYQFGKHVFYLKSEILDQLK